MYKRDEEREVRRMEECIFCRIAAGTIPCRKVYEDERVLAFEDIKPMAPVHIIIIPRRHIDTLMDVDPEGAADLQAMMSAARVVARLKGVDRKGFRVVINCNEEGGQVVFHLHMHLLGGRKLRDDLA
jgi:histidine triad (HIT) family protein